MKRNIILLVAMLLPLGIGAQNLNPTVEVTNDGGKDAGDYTVTFALKDTANYTWSDGSVTNQTFGWSITQKALKLIAEDKEVAHGAAAPAYTYKVDETDGLVAGDSNDFQVPFVAFPAPGPMPTDIIKADRSSWTFELNYEQFSIEDFSKMSVTVTNAATGKSYTCTAANNKLTNGQYGFDSEFVQKCIAEIQESLTIPEDQEEEGKEA